MRLNVYALWTSCVCMVVVRQMCTRLKAVNAQVCQATIQVKCGNYAKVLKQQ